MWVSIKDKKIFNVTTHLPTLELIIHGRLSTPSAGTRSITKEVSLQQQLRKSSLKQDTPLTDSKKDVGQLT